MSILEDLGVKQGLHSVSCLSGRRHTANAVRSKTYVAHKVSRGLIFGELGP